MFLGDVPDDEPACFEAGGDLKEGEEGDDIGEFAELGRTEEAGHPGADQKPQPHAENPVEQQPPGIADGFLKLLSIVQPLADDLRKVSGPGCIHGWTLIFTVNVVEIIRGRDVIARAGL